MVVPGGSCLAREGCELDRLAGEAGLSGEELMERAGRAAFDVLLSRWPAASRPAVLCGGGNNGGEAMWWRGWPAKPAWSR